jgi:hypothetical protein
MALIGLIRNRGLDWLYRPLGRHSVVPNGLSLSVLMSKLEKTV